MIEEVAGRRNLFRKIHITKYFKVGKLSWAETEIKDWVKALDVRK